VEVIRLADGVEQAVLVRAGGGGREEGERAVGGFGEGSEKGN
jgi:hypothetical protein